MAFLDFDSFTLKYPSNTFEMNYEFFKFHVYEHYENNPHDIQYEQYQDQVLLSPLQQQTVIAAFVQAMPPARSLKLFQGS